MVTNIVEELDSFAYMVEASKDRYGHLYGKNGKE
jgi:hypothetical protein